MRPPDDPLPPHLTQQAAVMHNPTMEDWAAIGMESNGPDSLSDWEWISDTELVELVYDQVGAASLSLGDGDDASGWWICPPDVSPYEWCCALVLLAAGVLR